MVLCLFPLLGSRFIQRHKKALILRPGTDGHAQIIRQAVASNWPHDNALFQERFKNTLCVVDLEGDEITERRNRFEIAFAEFRLE